MSTSASKKVRQANVHLTLEQLNALVKGNSITINLKEDNLTLKLTSETIRDEVDRMFAAVDKSFKKIFGK